MANPEFESKIIKRINDDGLLVTEIENPKSFKPLTRMLPEIVQAEGNKIILRGGGLKITLPEETLSEIKKMPSKSRVDLLNILLEASRNAKTFSIEEKSSVCLS